MSQLNAQLVAVDSDTPFARTERGIISGGYSHGIGPQLYPKAALNMITQMTTAFGVAGTSTRIQSPVEINAIAITTAPDIKIARRPHRSTSTHGGNELST